MQAFNRRAFLKGTGTLALAAAASGLLCGAAEVPEEPELCTVGGLRVHNVSAYAKDYGENHRIFECHLLIENTNDFSVSFNRENFLLHLGDARADIHNTFGGLNKWNGSKYIQDVQLAPGETQQIDYNCSLSVEGLESLLREEAPVPWCITLLYGQQRQSFTGYATPGHYSTEFTAGPVTDVPVLSVGGVTLSELWCQDSRTQQGPPYTLELFFKLQNDTGSIIKLPYNGWSATQGVLDNFTTKMDGAEKEHTRLYACKYAKVFGFSLFRLERGDHLLRLWPHKSSFASNTISLTEEEYNTLYTGGHIVELTFTCNGESKTIHLDPRTGIFEAV